MILENTSVRHIVLLQNFSYSGNTESVAINLSKVLKAKYSIYAFKPQPDRYLYFFKKGNKMTTFDKFFQENPEQKIIYEKEYNDFLLSEFILEKVTLTTFTSVLRCLGYQIKLEKCPTL